MKLPVRQGETPFHEVPSFIPEMELLLCCGGPHLLARNGNRLRRVLKAELDWNLVFRLANWHHMVPLLYWRLAQEKEGPPADVMETLRNSFTWNVGRSLAMTGELIALLEGLAEKDVLAVPYKGPILSHRLYGNVALRMSADLDVMVRRRDVARARQVLIDRGYAPSVQLEHSDHEFQVASRYSERFDRADSTVELHWAFTNKDVAFPLTLDDLVARLRVEPLSGCDIPVFSPDDTLLILCVHGAKHEWDRLEWICGVSEFLCAYDGASWLDLVRKAEKSQSARRLSLGLALAHDLFGAPLSEEMRARIHSDRRIPELASHVTRSLYDGDRNSIGVSGFGTIDHDLFHFRLGDGLPQSLRYVFYRMTTPSRPEMWSTVTIGGRSISLHSFTRPFHLGGMLVARLWGRLFSPNSG